MNEDNTNAKIVGCITLAIGLGAIYALFFHDWDKNKSLSGTEVLLYKKPVKSELRKGMKVAYADVNGDHTLIGKIAAISKVGIVKIKDAGSYSPDELRLIKK